MADLVDWVGAEGEYVRLHLDTVSYLHRESLSSMLQRLDARRFLRIHRSYIVNRDRIIAVGRSYRALVANVVAEQDALLG